MKRSGSQDPRYVIAPSPDGFDSLDGEDATTFASRYGLVLDPYQATTCATWLRRSASGSWCSDTWGISVARQNGKNASLEAVELYGMAVLGIKFLHTAHEVKTARKAFQRLLYFFDNPDRFPDLAALVLEVRRTNGQEAIVLRNGASIEFIARSKGSGRGFTVDVIVLDEAQDLRDEELEAISPANSAAPSGCPATIYMGTPPTADALADDGKGAPFLRVRTGAVSGSSSRTAWVEFSLDVDLDAMTDDEVVALVRDDRNIIATNPALGRRITWGAVEGERERFSARSFARERLNVWPVPQAEGRGAIDVDAWLRLGVEDVPAEWPLAAIGLDMDPVTGRLWVSPAAWSPDGVHVELVAGDLLAEGTTSAVDAIHRQVRRRRPVVVPYESPAMVLHAPLVARGVQVYPLSAREMAQATAAFKAAVSEGTLSHYFDPVLEQSIREAREEPLRTAPGQVRFKRVGELHAAPLWAAAGAAFGAVRWGKKPTSQTGQASTRKAVIL